MGPLPFSGLNRNTGTDSPQHKGSMPISLPACASLVILNSLTKLYLQAVTVRKEPSGHTFAYFPHFAWPQRILLECMLLATHSSPQPHSLGRFSVRCNQETFQNTNPQAILPPVQILGNRAKTLFIG